VKGGQLVWRNIEREMKMEEEKRGARSIFKAAHAYARSVSPINQVFPPIPIINVKPKHN
jgi:hypothetical protein